MHKHGIYHCDIKMKNILYNKKDFKIIDFDISAKISESNSSVIDQYYFEWPVENILLNPNKTLAQFQQHVARYQRDLEYNHNNHIIIGDSTTIYEKIRKMDHFEFITLFYQKLDTWCLGFTLSQILNKVLTYNLVLDNLCCSMCHPNIEQRLSISEATEIYSQIVFMSTT